MARFSTFLVVLSAWFISSSAQFGFFDQMFGNQGHQQQQQPQNVRSDSQWYQAQYEGGKIHPAFPPTPTHTHLNILLPTVYNFIRNTR